MIRTILLDIEGTTTPIEFVTGVLFPYVRLNLKDFLARNGSNPSITRDLQGLREERDLDRRSGAYRLSELVDSCSWAEKYIHWLMDQDRKSTALKSIQGKMWEDGYRAGELKGQVFADVPKAFQRWKGQGKKICIYSSGSVLAQKLLFANTDQGDLTGFLSSYFDTTIGPKKNPASYKAIATALGDEPSSILFISDSAEELDAAFVTSIQTVYSDRPGNPPAPEPLSHPVTRDFDEIFP